MTNFIDDLLSVHLYSQSRNFSHFQGFYDLSQLQDTPTISRNCCKIAEFPLPIITFTSEIATIATGVVLLPSEITRFTGTS